jgi:hypothetical protein
MAQAISMSVWSLGSERSRPESHPRQNICAGPITWLKNTSEVIGSNSPRSTSGARHCSTASASREFCARCAPRISSVHSLRVYSGAGQAMTSRLRRTGAITEKSGGLAGRRTLPAMMRAP